MIEDNEGYLNKNRARLDSDDYILAEDNEENLVSDLRKKMKEIMTECGLSQEEQSKYMMTGAEVAEQYLLIKVHKKNKGSEKYS